MTKTRASPSASTCNHIGILKIKDSVFVDTEEGVTDLVDWITAQHIYNEGYPPPLYIDVEGERLGRDGTVSLLTIFQYPTPRRECVYVIDVHTLGSQVFSTVGAFGKTLEEILESPAFLKIFFDDRNDSDALSSLYCIKLQGVRDVQLMESAQRQTMSSRKFLGSLAKCIDEKAYHSEEKERWRLRKEKGDKLWNPREGDSYRAFNARPLPKDLMAYCLWKPRKIEFSSPRSQDIFLKAQGEH
ncbi:hypothetical protein NW762_013390 [Fusarium torreyae]|uniref:3'-5' exonuclease domain-containing protein n=1 Tax=Fusarium torreyae TaxID=1237075 RepID=A0A9W8RMB0_9HYPO|nr:hypothetical protein NW762_013390 [Fusarium torreyae]